MTSNETNTTYDKLKNDFTKATAKIIIFKTENRKLPTDKQSLQKYLDDLILSYNTFSLFTKQNIQLQEPAKQEKIHNSFTNTYKPRLFEALAVLNLTADTPENFDQLDGQTLRFIPKQTETQPPQTNLTLDSELGATGGIPRTETQKETVENTNLNNTEQTVLQISDSDPANHLPLSTGTVPKPTNPNHPNQINSNRNSIHPTTTNVHTHNALENSFQFPSRRESLEFHNFEFAHNNSQINMADPNQTIEQFLKAAGPILNYKYNGDPLKLNSFIRDVKLIRKLAKNEITKDFCLSYVLARLDDRAEEIVPDTVESIDEILEILDEKIKPDPTKVIEGRMMALQLERNNYTKFAKNAEELAEAYRRGLVNDGVPRKLAEEMTIKKCIELCRKTSRNSIVKSVVTSTKYETAKEVIATFIVENDTAKQEYKEKQISQQNSNRNDQKRGGYKKNYRGNSGQNNGNRAQNFSNGNRNYQNQNQNQSRGYNNNYRGNGNSNRGGHRGGNSNRPEHTIRIVSGQPQAQQAEAQNAQPEQFFRLPN